MKKSFSTFNKIQSFLLVHAFYKHKDKFPRKIKKDQDNQVLKIYSYLYPCNSC